MMLSRRLLWTSIALAFLVVVLGAYVRLSDAGLGCPDWPGCYGRATPWHAAASIAAVELADPWGPVSYVKAWIEMLHRYLAATLGLAVLVIAGLGWHRLPPAQRVLPSTLFVLVLVQALLGMWTVTTQLRPVVVAAHLLGGMSTLALLAALTARVGGAAAPVRRPTRGPRDGGGQSSSVAFSERPLRSARLLLVLVFLQIALGAWVSAHRAALICPDLPGCRGEWWPEMDFASAFSASGTRASLTLDALTAIHVCHRLGAVVVLAASAWLAWRLLRTRWPKVWSLGLLATAGLQFLLGMGNVALGLPLVVALAHTAGAGVLLAMLVAINLRLAGGRP